MVDYIWDMDNKAYSANAKKIATIRVKKNEELVAFAKDQFSLLQKKHLAIPIKLFQA